MQGNQKLLGPRGAADLSLTEALFDHYKYRSLVEELYCAEKSVPVMSDSVSKHCVHIGPIMGD